MNIKPDYKKKHYTYSPTEIYKHYKRYSGGTLSMRDFKRIAARIMYLVSLAIIREHYVFVPPFSLGKFFVNKKKITDLKNKVNWPESKKKGKLVYYLNRHSDWCYFRIKWSKLPRNSCNFRHREMYEFQPVKDEKRREIGKLGLADWILKLANDPYSKNYDALER